MRVAVSAKAVLGASARIYLLPVAGLLAGAGLAQLIVTALISPEAGGNAAGIGGIAGTVLAVLLGRRLARRQRAGAPAQPRVVDVLPEAPRGEEPSCGDPPAAPGTGPKIRA